MSNNFELADITKARQLLRGEGSNREIVTESLSKFATSYATLLQEINSDIDNGKADFKPNRAKRILASNGLTAGFLVRILAKLEKNIVQVHNTVSATYDAIAEDQENVKEFLLKWFWSIEFPDEPWQNQLDPDDFDVVKDKPLTGFHLVCNNQNAWNATFSNYVGKQFSVRFELDTRMHEAPLTISNNTATWQHERAHALHYEQVQNKPDTGMIRVFTRKLGEVSNWKNIIGIYLKIVQIFRTEFISSLGSTIQKEVQADLESDMLTPEYLTYLESEYFTAILEPGSQTFQYFIHLVQEYPMYDDKNLSQFLANYISAEQWQQLTTPDELLELLTESFKKHFGGVTNIDYQEQFSLLQRQLKHDLAQIKQLMKVYLLEMLIFTRRMQILLKTEKIGSSDQDRSKMIALMMRNLKYVDFQRLSTLVTKQFKETKQYNVDSDLNLLWALFDETKLLDQFSNKKQARPSGSKPAVPRRRLTAPSSKLPDRFGRSGPRGGRRITPSRSSQ